jgi:CheY-like chemotaxis protein
MTMPAARILVVEDDEDIRDVLVILLRAEGFTTTAAKDGIEALEQLGRGPPPSVILLDLMMPRLDGEGFVHAIRADPALARIPIVIMSGHGAVRQKATELAAASFLVKPIDVGAMLAVIRKLTAARA